MSHVDNLAFLPLTVALPPGHLFQAHIVGLVGEWCLFESRDGSGRAKKSVSCFLQPEIGDEVMIFSGDPHAFVLSVLSRSSSACSASIHLPKNSQLTCMEGNLLIESASLTLRGQDDLKLQSASLSMLAKHSDLRMERVNGWFGMIDVRTIGLRLVANQFTSMCGRLIQRAKESFRWVDGKDELRAGHVRIQAKEHVRVTAEHASIRAKGFVKIDGQKIDLG